MTEFQEGIIVLITGPIIFAIVVELILYISVYDILKANKEYEKRRIEEEKEHELWLKEHSVSWIEEWEKIRKK